MDTSLINLYSSIATVFALGPIVVGLLLAGIVYKAMK